MHSLRAYSIRVKTANIKEYEHLSNINGHDLKDIIHDTLVKLERNYAQVDHDDVKKVYKVSKLDVNGRYISGQLVSGPYGFASNILDTTSDTITYNKSTREAEIIPLYFMFYIGEGSHGFAIFQRHGLNGIKGYLHDEIWAEFQDKTKGHLLQITPVMDQDAFNKILDDGMIKKVRFVNYSPPADIADVVNGFCTNDEEGEIEIQVKPKRNSSFSNAASILKKFIGERPSGILTTLDDHYTELKVEIERDGKKRTLNFTDPSNFRMDIDITDDVKMSRGHPVYKSIDIYSKVLVEELLHDLAGQG